MDKATSKQTALIHVILHRRGLLAEKENIVSSFSNGRTSKSTELTVEEASDLISTMNTTVKSDNPSQPMLNKLFAMCHEMGWIKVVSHVEGNQIKKRKDYSHVHAWVEKFGFAKKPLSRYQYAELPKLLSQFQNGPYADWLRKGD